MIQILVVGTWRTINRSYKPFLLTILVHHPYSPFFLTLLLDHAYQPLLLTITIARVGLAPPGPPILINDNNDGQ